MRSYFKPYPWLTVFTVISLAILISLGYWQSQRLVWKTNLLAQVEISANAAPFTSLVDVDAALASDIPIDFHRIEFAGDVLAEQTPFLVYFRQKTRLSWRPFLATKSQDKVVFVAGSPIADTERETYLGQEIEATPSSIAGYVRLARGPVRGEVKSTPSLNRWFSFNPLPETDDWGQSVPSGAETRFYIDAVSGATSATALPVNKPDIRNNHFDYMLTWYGLALCLFIIYILLHVRGGRLGRRSRVSS